MNKKTVKTLMGVAVVSAVSLSFIGGTYARYTSSFGGNSTVSVAKWKVSSTGGDTLNLSLTADTNQYVKSGKIAPGTGAKGTVELDLTETEVAVDVIASIDANAVATALTQAGVTGVTNSDISATVTIKKGGTTITGGANNPIALPSSGAFTASDKVTVEVAVTWTNTETHNADHTTVGKTAPTLTIPVTLTVQQHVG